jgi:DtxR family transcriptional regulator, Mn-dependent transcriptional regulator
VIYFTKDKVYLIFCEVILTTASISIEDYIGAIYRLQKSAENLLPLSELQDFFGFSPISIHEMVQKLESLGLAEYQPYRGVRLTEKGRDSAQSLVRRHRIWEVFLADKLHVPMDEAHQLAGDLEHAAPDWITERLFEHLGKPDFCPHGSKIGDSPSFSSEILLREFLVGKPMVVTKIYPEKKNVLEEASMLGLIPGKKITLLIQNEEEIGILLEEKEEVLTSEMKNCIWGTEYTHGN